MSQSITVAVPSYCRGMVPPWSSHYATCLKAGWNEPTTTAATAGHTATSGVGVFLAVLVVALILFAMARRSGSRRTATQS